jgi:urea transport system ATP-binding protein
MLTVDRVDLFYGAAQALRSVSVKAQTGRILTVLGRNGVGKSSLLRAIVGQHMPASGSIRWNDQDMTKMTPYLRAKAGFGYVPQGREIFPLLTVRENLMTGYATRPRSERAIDDEIFALFPVLNDMLGRRGGDLSGGQQQQLAIARALVTKPKLLVLTSRAKASSRRSLRTSAARSCIYAARARWRSSSSSNISSGPAISATTMR